MADATEPRTLSSKVSVSTPNVYRASVSPDILLVSCADKLKNALAIVTDLKTHGDAVFDRFKAGKDGTLWYYVTLARVFERRLPTVL